MMRQQAWGATRQVFVAVVLATACLGLADISGFTRGYGPKAALRVAEPSIMWEVWPGEGCEITKYAMSINGRSVAAVYKDRAVRYSPSAPLAPGTYKVHCEALINGSMPMKRDWEFTIAPDALTELPEQGPDQKRALDQLNLLRMAMGLDMCHADARMAAAAQAHCEYLEKNNRAGHQEVASEPGFAGIWPSDRLEAFGYVGDSWECVATGHEQSRDGILGLFDAPYHRIPMMEPGSPLAGAGFSGDRVAIEMEMTHSRRTIVYPYPNQDNVPCSWYARERPNPLRKHAEADTHVGYVVTFCHYNPTDGLLRVESATLKDGFGNEVDCYLNTPQNDGELKVGLLLIPKKPLKPLERYFVSVKAMNDVGQDVSMDWQFTTGPQ